MPTIQFIDTNDEFTDFCLGLLNKKVIAIDTEFLRVNTFYPKAGLFQINDGERIVLADPCAITEWQLFKEVLVHPNIVKVLHACDEDIELLIHFLQIEPVNVFDTQVAAAFCGYDFCMGYQRLLKAMLEVDLEKGHSRSDWMQRPLSDEQIHYAADDVRYLLVMYELLYKKLEQKQQLHMVEEEYQTLLKNFRDRDFNDAYLRIKEAWRLSPKQFLVLRTLATWREKKMREKDFPRKRIANDDALIALASKTHWTQSQLFDVDGLPAATIRAEGEALLHMVAVAQTQVAIDKAPKPIKGDAFYQHFKKLLEAQAIELEIDVKMLSKKTLNEPLYWRMQAGDFSLPETLQGWRRVIYQSVIISLGQVQESV